MRPKPPRRTEHDHARRLLQTLPGLWLEIPLPNGTRADLAGRYFVAEIEYAPRWQHGLAQVLEYWDQTARTTTPALILLTTTTTAELANHPRTARATEVLGVQLWTWRTDLETWTRGGPPQLPTRPPVHPPTLHDGTPYTPPPRWLTAVARKPDPYRTWYRTAAAR